MRPVHLIERLVCDWCGIGSEEKEKQASLSPLPQRTLLLEGEWTYTHSRHPTHTTQAKQRENTMPRAKPAKKAAEAEAPVAPPPAAEAAAPAPEEAAPEAAAKEEEGEASETTSSSGSSAPETHDTTTTGNNKKKAEAIEGSDAEEQPSNKRQKRQQQEEEAAEEGEEAEASAAVKDDLNPPTGGECEEGEEDPEILMKSIIEKQKELQEAKEKAQQRLNEVRSVCCVWVCLSCLLLLVVWCGVL